MYLTLKLIKDPNESPNNFLGLCVLCTSCKKEQDIVESKDNSGVVIKRPHVWAQSITDDDNLMNPYYVQETALYNDNLLIGVRKNNRRNFQLINTTNGNPIWDWYDIFEDKGYLAVQQPIILNNHFIWVADYWNYCIDLNTGQTVWKNTFAENYDQRTSGLGDKFTGQYNYDGNSNRPLNGGMAAIFNKDNGKPYFSITPRYDTTGMQPFNLSQRRGEVRFNKLFVEGADTLLLLSFIDPPLYDYNYRECLALYNLSKKQWIYDRADMLGMTRSGTNHAPCLYQGKVYTPYSGAVVCNDLMTGKKLWQSDVESGTAFATDGVIVAENKLYGNSANGYMYCWNLETGQQIWRIRTSGTGSRLSYLNGVLYFTGAGDGNLHAIEAATGKYLWKIESPDKKKNQWAVFTGLCAVVPGKNGAKGKVIVLNGLNAYCYEAER